jgi:aminoglycoside phosphotransferase family enzyme/predicted kinase
MIEVINPPTETAQQQVIDFLSSPETYGAEGNVERIDTHISHIFLAGDRAFKLKRAIALDYLDFSTLAKRRAACETELRLNRRTAPDLYLDVISVKRAVDGSLGFDHGRPIDWLVVMRRFAKDDLLEVVARRGGLTSAMANKLADTIAEFHHSLDPVDTIDGSNRLIKIVEENDKCLKQHAGQIFPDTLIQSLFDCSMAQMIKLAPLLDQRAAQGHIRHGHGDLHLANICLWKGEPTLFDCLEFDAELATTDILYDLAFLLMDLWQSGLHVQANELLNRYLYMADEEANGIAVVPLFLSIRAAIRAHVSAAQAMMTDDNRKSKRLINKANDYLAGALEFLSVSKPRLIAIGGLSGTGKSTLARSIAPRIGSPLGARLLRTDILRKRIFGVKPETHLDSQAYGREQGEKVYAKLMQDVEEALEAGWTVVADGVFALKSERDAISRIATKYNVPFVGLWLEAPLEQMQSRVAQRTGDASDAGSDVVERQLGYDIGNLDDWTIIDSSARPQEVSDTVLSFLRDGEQR